MLNTPGDLQTSSGHLTAPRLEGRRAVVTGAARGIGAAIATRYVEQGCSVALIDVDVDRVCDTARRIGARFVTADLRSPEAARAATTEAIDALGGIDILVNNAGVLRISPVLEITAEEWDLTFEVNARAMLFTTQIAAKAMIISGGGHIVNMASMGGKVGAPGQAHYAASKAAVISFTQVCAQEFGPHGITVNCICPGYVLTEMGAATRTDEMVKAWSAKSPLGRLAEPSDVADMALFLASDESSYVTGQAFNVCGGMVMH